MDDRSPSEKKGLLRQVLDRLILKRKIFWAVTLLIFALDLGTKEMAIDYVRENTSGRPCWVQEPWFALVEVSNKGGPWGLGSEYSNILRFVRLAALGVILFILASTPLAYRFQTFSLALVMGGALGNIWDSWKYGSVRDFLYFDLGFPPANPWPAFNLADSTICIGVIGLALAMLFTGRKPRNEEIVPSEEEAGIEG